MTARSAPVQAALWMIGSILAFSLMAVAGREVSAELDTFEIMMYRSLFGLLIVGAVITASGRMAQIRSGRMRLHLGRNIAHFIGQNLWFYALTAIPMAQVFALEFTSPVWVLLLSPLLLGERLTAIRGLAAGLGFIGILIVTRPTPETVNLGTLAAALSAIGFALTNIATKRLTLTDNLLTILFWMTAMQSVMGFICAGADFDIALPSAQGLPWVIIIALCGIVAHFSITKALSLASATLVVPVDFGRLPVIMLVGVVLYGESLDLFVFVGAAIIFAANYLNIWSETRSSC